MSTEKKPISRRGALLAGTAAVAGGLGLAGSAAAAPLTRPTGPTGPPHTHPADPRRLRLTPGQQAGQRVIFSYPGLTPPSSLLNEIRAGRAGGVIFFGENISSLTQISGVVRQLKEAQEASPVDSPLLLMTDQEGGLVRRLPGAPTMSAKDVGQAADPEAAATNAGTGAGNNLAGVGMNLNLAPVLDVYRTPGDFEDQFERSFSNDQHVVGTLGADFISAQQTTGVLATAKHFPGLGAATATQNTDLRPVTINVSLHGLTVVDMKPYEQAIAAGVRLVMLSWAIYTNLDAGRPAGMSKKIIQDQLRTRLGFTGVTITDALEAGALAGYGDSPARAVLAAQAGMDLMLCSARDVGQGINTAAALAAALASGKLNGTEFTASVQRITTLRHGLS